MIEVQVRGDALGTTMVFIARPTEAEGNGVDRTVCGR